MMRQAMPRVATRIAMRRVRRRGAELVGVGGMGLLNLGYGHHGRNI